MEGNTRRCLNRIEHFLGRQESLVRIEKSEIASKISVLKNAIPAKTTIQEMKGILLHAGRLITYNTELEISTEVDSAHPDESFVIPMNAIELIKNLPDGAIDISKAAGKGSTIRIKSGGISSSFQSGSPENFARMDDVESGERFSADIEDLQKMVSSISYAVSVDANRPQYNGILFDADGEELNLVALDGTRAAWAHCPFRQTFKFVVPRTAIKALLDIGLDAGVRIACGRRHAEFEIGEYKVKTRLLEGSWLDYKKAFPTAGDTVEINRAALMDAAKRTMICCQSAAKNLIKLEFSDTVVKVSSREAFGEYSEEIPISTSVNDGLRIGFNARYLADALKSYDAEVLPFRFVASASPLVIDHGNVRSMVLPVRLKKEQ